MWNKILSWFWMKPNEVLRVQLTDVRERRSG